jgi:hypothetical protein
MDSVISLNVIQHRVNNISDIDRHINNGLDVEVDIWAINDFLFLGHDGPEHKVSLDFLTDPSRSSSIWAHCKNIQALYRLQTVMNCFYHTDEDFVLTSKGFVWKYPEVYHRGNLYAVCIDHGFEFKGEYDGSL